jgi:hypothetical protein
MYIVLRWARYHAMFLACDCVCFAWGLKGLRAFFSIGVGAYA